MKLRTCLPIVALWLTTAFPIAAQAAMTSFGTLGPYPTDRDASGTSWQPDAVTTHQGLHVMTKDWMFMVHGVLNGVYDTQSGPRGDDGGFASGMLMGTARRNFDGGDTLNFTAMLSPDPLMGKRGYPLLLAAGETADGATTLIDRQHPHDFFMELSGTYSHPLSKQSSVFIYAGLPGAPAFGPPPFMHRLSIMESPEAPISHHWLDSTHITFGVVTGGIVFEKNWKLEASGFRGREPDEHRYDIEAPKLDSTAVRLSWNPTERVALQISWAHLTSPEQLEPADDQTRFSASAIYTLPLGDDGWWSTSLSWGRKQIDHHAFDAFALESAVKPLEPWTFFARGEVIETNELLVAHGPTETVGKISLGGVHDWTLSDRVKFGVGGLYAFNFTSTALSPLYGGNPGGAMIFARLKLT
jgi:hypothetical protein